MTGLADRFAEHLAQSGVLPARDPLVVAVSGGLDSTVLLHLLRFRGAENPLIVAHFDHAMRPGSAADARWVAGLARGWGLAFEVARADRSPRGETEARDLRYHFLDDVVARHGAAGIVTAHHADDQAETVLFRVLRGTGIRGLRGMAPAAGGRLRPLLPFWRRELLVHAREASLAWRDDPTNRTRAAARNVLRNEILPRLEEEVAPGSRRALVRLARHATAVEAAWHGAERILLEAVIESEEARRIVLARPRLLLYDRAVRLRVIRGAARRLGIHLSEAGTRVAMEFSSRGESGRGTGLPGGLRLSRSFDLLVLAPARDEKAEESADAWVLVPEPADGSAPAVIGGHPFHVRWGGDPKAFAGMPDPARFRSDVLRFPLRVRAPAPGDRLRLPAGTKKVVRILAEARIPRESRERTPVVVDAGGRVLWVPGVARSVEAVPEAGRGEFYIGVEDAHSR